MVHHKTDKWFHGRREFGYQVGIVVSDIEHEFESLDEGHIHHWRSVRLSSAGFGGECFGVASYCLVDGVR